MGLQEGQQIRRRTLFQLGRAAAGAGALGDAVPARPGLVFRLAHRPAGGHHEVASVILDEVSCSTTSSRRP